MTMKIATIAAAAMAAAGLLSKEVVAFAETHKLETVPGELLRHRRARIRPRKPHDPEAMAAADAKRARKAARNLALAEKGALSIVTNGGGHESGE
mgnify:CR=1 FL=1